MSKSKIIQGLDEFTRAYLVCALWSSNDESTPSGGEPLDKNYEIEDFSLETLLSAIEDCQKFQEEEAANLVDYPLGNAGHDFWLTRNHHGCGFWENDFGTPEACERLTTRSHAFGDVSLYVHRKRIYA